MLNRTTLGTLTLLVPLATGAAGFAAGKTTAQDPVFSVEPSPQHEWLASLAGNYTTKVSGMLGDSAGKSQSESIVGGLWSLTRFETSLMGQPVQGLELMGYDTLQEKYVSVYVDSMSTMLTILEGSYDEETKKLTMSGTSTGMDGMKAQMTNVTEIKEDGMTLSMSIEGMPSPMMTVDYTRK